MFLHRLIKTVSQHSQFLTHIVVVSVVSQTQTFNFGPILFTWCHLPVSSTLEADRVPAALFFFPFAVFQLRSTVQPSGKVCLLLPFNTMLQKASAMHREPSQSSGCFFFNLHLGMKTSASDYLVYEPHWWSPLERGRNPFREKPQVHRNI